MRKLAFALFNLCIVQSVWHDRPLAMQEPNKKDYSWPPRRRISMTLRWTTLMGSR